MTNTWTDIANANLILVMGGNAAEAHPCGFKWVTEAKAHNAARLIVVDPRFTRTASVADYYAPIRTGTDIAFMGGLINYLLTEDKIQHEYVRNYTDVSFIVKAGMASKTASSAVTTSPNAATPTNPAGVTSWARTASSESTRPCKTRAASIN
ncbi:Nitrate reductase [Pseudomonas fluorescens]|uniref:Nitrate reductase n=1 Tax=Pseudomonas fluorescens TaxID=294 RepID=A0A5E6R207_PSEFL|nr:Nitrate reductase [Pseudomonas fluorescens]